MSKPYIVVDGQVYLNAAFVAYDLAESEPEAKPAELPADPNSYSIKVQPDSQGRERIMGIGLGFGAALEALTKDQKQAISERVINEIFFHAFDDSEEEIVEGDTGLKLVGCIGRKRLAEEELSRRMDAAMSQCVETLKRLNRFG